MKNIKLSTTKFRQHLFEYLNLVYYRGIKITITRHGKITAIVIPTKNASRLKLK